LRDRIKGARGRSLRAVTGRSAFRRALEKDHVGEAKSCEYANSAHARFAPYGQPRCATIARRLSIYPLRPAAARCI
jgi:hypothetical protein